MSTLPSVSVQISSAVVLRWISGLASLANCWAQMEFSVLATISWAFSTAPRMPSEPGVSTISAPKARSMTRRSVDMVSGMVRMTL